MKQVPAQTLLIAFLGLSGCLAVTPYSLRPGSYSATTGLSFPTVYMAEVPPLGASEKEKVLLSIESQPVPNPAPFPDYKVLKYSSDVKLCHDTFKLPSLSKVNKGIELGPGAVLFS
jgi:hypothetical protein